MNKISTFRSPLSKAQHRLYSTYVALRKEKEISQISVVELCKAADVNRSTFYRNSSDVFDLERKIEEYCINSIVNYLCSIDYPYYAERIGNDESGLQFPSFEDELALETFYVFGHDKSLYKRLFNRLLSEAPFLAFEKNEKKLKLLKLVFSFVLNGAFVYCSNSSTEKGRPNINSLFSIVFYSFKAFYDKIINNENFDPLPISEIESLLIPQKKERLNVKKTKRSLKKAFVELLETHPIEKISVSKLCEKAEICNSTFYTHYNGIENYINSLLEETIDGFLQIADEFHRRRDEETLRIKDLIASTEKSKKLFLAFISGKRYKEFFRYQKILINHSFNYVNNGYNCKFDPEISFKFVCYCSWGILFEPFFEHEVTPAYAFKLAYFVFLNLFERKAVLDEVEI